MSFSERIEILKGLLEGLSKYEFCYVNVKTAATEPCRVYGFLCDMVIELLIKELKINYGKEKAFSVASKFVELLLALEEVRVLAEILYTSEDVKNRYKASAYLVKFLSEKIVREL